MATRSDAMTMVRANLCERVDRLSRSAVARRPVSLTAGVADLASAAAEYGLVPLADLASALGRALDAGASGNTVRLYLDAMRDAAGCERADPAAREAYLASVGLRLAG